MLDCWRENPVDRPTFERLKNTMKEMERNHKVRRVRTFFKRDKQSWKQKVHLGQRLIIFQELKLRGVCSTFLPPSYITNRLIKYWIDCCIYFSFRLVSSEAVNFESSIRNKQYYKTAVDLVSSFGRVSDFRRHIGSWNNRAPYSWNMVDLFSFGCPMIYRSYVRTYASTGRKGSKGREGCLRRVLATPHLVYRTFTKWSIDSCQNRIATDQYHMTISRAHVSTHPGDVIYLEAFRRAVNCFTRSYFLAGLKAQQNW